MNKNINQKNNNNELWFNWLTRKLNSYEPFGEFDLGKNPVDVAETFINVNKEKIFEVFKQCDEEDKDTLEQFQKLAECEWHIFRILNNQLNARNKVRFVDFKKRK